MRLIFMQIGVILLMANCQGPNQEQSNTDDSNVHKVSVQEVIQTSSYTYLRVKENDKENWLAVPKMQAELAATYYYKGGMKMTNFNSKELGRVFESVYFLENLATNPDGTGEVTKPISTPISTPNSNPNSANHEVVVQEVIYTSAYTYLRVKEGDKENWLAVPKMQAQVGATYYHAEGMPMKNFHSKELNRDFETVYFLAGVKAKQENTLNITNESAKDHTSSVKSTVVKTEIKIEPVEGGITISELFSAKEKYAGKTVKIRGKVTKYNASIMSKNWIHIQDGTDFEGKFDLTVTSAMEFKVDDIVTIEGKVALNKDFGYGYSYDVLVEEAVIVK